VRGQVEKYMGKLLRDRSAVPGRIGFAVLDDETIEGGAPDLSGLAAGVLSRLSCLGVFVGVPSLPFADFLVRRAPADATRLVPADAETRTFLHDIPFSRRGGRDADPGVRAAELLAKRKGAILEGTGIAAVGPLTPEQTYINYSSVFHAAYVQYLVDVLRDGFRLPGEEEAFRSFRERLPAPSANGLAFREPPLEDPAEIAAEIEAVGRCTVEQGLVDSAFGNISCRARGTIFISQTGASLDELAGCVDPVPDDGGSTAGITASSELPAHRRIYEATGARAILHGHPKFAVAMSMLCGEKLGDTPIVGGETGAGGLAERVAPVIGRAGKAIVRGHGVFTVGRNGLGEAFRAMAEVENLCREEYFRRLDARAAAAPDQSKSE
jgi:ribulose-5-phosphate 4-epimerase/fuculose-1-phosphate aldolase